MLKKLLRNKEGQVALFLVPERTDTAETVKNEINGILKHYTQYGYAKLSGIDIINKMPGAIIAFDNESLAMKLDENDVYRNVEYSEMDTYKTI